MKTVYLTNWSSYRTPGCFGTGRKLSIMARPRAWERGDGRIWMLTPRKELFDEALRIGLAAYRERYIEQVSNSVGGLPIRETYLEEIQDGDTLCCACSRGAAEVGGCHRVWAAELLRDAGLTVILDGKGLLGLDENHAPIFDKEAA